jgi:hypothetical protein
MVISLKPAVVDLVYGKERKKILSNKGEAAAANRRESCGEGRITRPPGCS